MTTPGSVEAVQQGCTCPISDNKNGKGLSINEDSFFWVSHECPLHFSKEIKEKLGKTVMIFDNEEGIDFLVLEGDFSQLNGQYLNAEGDELLAELMYDNVTGEPKVKFLKEFPLQAVLDGAKVIVCGFAS